MTERYELTDRERLYASHLVGQIVKAAATIPPAVAIALHDAQTNPVESRLVGAFLMFRQAIDEITPDAFREIARLIEEREAGE